MTEDKSSIRKDSSALQTNFGNIMSMLSKMMVMSCLGGERGFKIP